MADNKGLQCMQRGLQQRWLQYALRAYNDEQVNVSSVIVNNKLFVL